VLPLNPMECGISQLDGPPDPHSAQDEPLEAPASRDVNLQGYTDPTRSAAFPTKVNNDSVG
jgi:hypothetical protein